MFVYFGSHGSGQNIGFSLAHFDTDTGRLTAPALLQEAVAPAYFIIRPDGKRLYTCNSAPGSSVSAYAIDPATAHLMLLNEKPSGRGDPSYVSLNATGRFLMVANYAGGSIAVYALRPDGSLGERTAFVQHTGAGFNPERQDRPHAHPIRVDPTNPLVLVAVSSSPVLAARRANVLALSTGSEVSRDPLGPYEGASVLLPGMGTTFPWRKPWTASQTAPTPDPRWTILTRT